MSHRRALVLVKTRIVAHALCSLFFSQANSGSMIRSEKIPPTQTLAEAIHDKYIITEDTLRLDAEMLKEVQKQLHASLFEVRAAGHSFLVNWAVERNRVVVIVWL